MTEPVDNEVDGVAVDSTSVYWMTESLSAVTMEVWKRPLGGPVEAGPPQLLAGPGLHWDNFYLFLARGNLYIPVTEAGYTVVVPTDGSPGTMLAVVPLYVDESGLFSIETVSKECWIFKYALDGTFDKRIGQVGCKNGSVASYTFTTNEKYIFWLDAIEGKVMRACK